MSEESPIQLLQRQVSEEEEEENGEGDNLIQQYQMRRTWETRYVTSNSLSTEMIEIVFAIFKLLYDRFEYLEYFLLCETFCIIPLT